MSVCRGAPRRRVARSLLSLAAALALAGSAAAQPPPPAVRPLPAVPPPPDPPPVVDVTPPELANRPATVLDGAPACRAACSPAVLATAEYLLVRPYRRPNDFAITDPFNDLTPEGGVNSVRFDWSSGFRVGLGYRTASGWEPMLTYTHLHAGGSRFVVAPDGGVVYPTLTRPGLIDTVQQAGAALRLDYDVFDLDSSRRIVLDDSFALRLGFGVRIASIDQSFDAFYNGFEASGALVHNRIIFDGAGPVLNGEGEWLLPRGFRWFGRARGALVVGDLSSRLRETDNGGLTLNANIRECNTQAIPVLELATGLAWEYRNLRLSAGYEVANWFGLVDRPQFVNDVAEGKLGRRRGDLSLEGVFFQLGVAY
jgi:hypothetical protein